MEISKTIKLESDTYISRNDNIILHDDILDILFKHKEEIHRKLSDLQGTLLIDHIAIKIIDPNKKLLIFSITPSVEYNILVQGLWKHDKSFSTYFHNTNKFYSWEEAYSKLYFHKIKQIKETKHGFTFGFNISKKIDEFNLIYSFATRSQNKNLHDYYYNHLNKLYSLGDYSYRLIHNIYAKYCDPIWILPSMNSVQSHPISSKPLLKLIINNK